VNFLNFEIESLLDNLNRRRRYTSNFSSISSTIVVLVSAGLILYPIINKGFNAENLFLVLLSLTALLLIIFLIKNICFWILELFFIKELFLTALNHSPKSIVALSPSLQSLQYSRYASFRAITLIYSERTVLTWILIILSLVSFYLIIPPFLLLVGLSWRYLFISSHAELELNIMEKLPAENPLRQLIESKNQSDVNDFISSFLDKNAIK
jgi:hypothetical protein